MEYGQDQQLDQFRHTRRVTADDHLSIDILCSHVLNDVYTVSGSVCRKKHSLGQGWRSRMN